MAGITIDLTNYKDKSSARVPEGTYLVNIEDLEQTTTRNGDPMVVVYLKIIGGDQDGLNLVDRLTLTEKAMFRMVDFLRGLGIKTPKKRLQIDPSKIIGRKVQVEVADGELYRGSIKSEIKGYMRVAKKPSTSSDEDVTEGDDLPDIPEEAPAAAEPEAPAAEEKSTSATPEDTTEDADIDLDDIEV